jgi:DNA-binding transcriptional MerR regulator
VDGVTETLTLSEVARKLELPAETVRYWARAGLFGTGSRNGGHRRRLSAADLELVDMIRHLRVTDMPIRLVRRFTELVRQGPATEQSRLELLREHRDAVLASIRAKQAALEVVEAKIARYERSTPSVDGTVRSRP